MKAKPREASSLLRVCLDLNVWVADFLGTLRRQRGGSSCWLTDALRSGMSPAGPLQLVISFGMMERLSTVLTRDFAVSAATADSLMRAISNISEFGPAGDYPHLVLGASVYPIRDEEDSQVLEVAVAGQADLLVTANLRDFAMSGIKRVGDGSRVRVYDPPGRGALIIAHPDDACGWLRTGAVPTGKAASAIPRSL